MTHSSLSKRISTVGLLALIAVMGVGCVKVDRAAQEQAKKTEAIVSDPSVLVRLEPAMSRTIAETAEISGNIVTGRSTDIGAKQTGRLDSVYVQDGDSVTAGQVLGVQDSSQLRTQLQQAYGQLTTAQSQLAQQIKNAQYNPTKTSAAIAQAQAQVRSARASLQKAVEGARPQEKAQAQAQVASTRVNLQTAQTELARVQKLVDAGAVATSRLEQQRNAVASAQSQYDSAVQSLSLLNEGTRSQDIEVAREGVRAAEEGLRTAMAQRDLDRVLQDQVAAARGQVDSARAAVSVLQQQINDMTIRAPFAGTVNGQPAQAGTILGGGVTLLTLVGQGGAYFEGDVPEQLIQDIAVGKPLNVRIDALNRSVPAKVTALNPVGSNVGRLFKARITLSTLTPDIKPGMFARGSIAIRQAANAVVVPQNAIVTRDGKDVIFTVKDGAAVAIPVTRGIADGAHIQVTGLEPGIQIVVRGQESLDNGSKTRLESATDAAADPAKATP